MKHLLLAMLFPILMSCTYFEKPMTAPQPEAPADSEIDASVTAMWNKYRAAHSEEASSKLPGSWFFHNNEEDANRLGKLVASGKKQAGSGLYAWYKEAGAPLPETGTKHIITDFDEKALAIIVITDVDTIPFNQITAAYASLDMGTNEKPLEKWKEAHWEFFTTALAESDQKPTEDMLVVCEYFKTVWPKTTTSIQENTVALTLEQATFALTNVPNEVVVKMHNTTAAPIVTGLRFSLECYTGSEWKSLVPEMAFNDIGYTIDQNRSHQFTIDLIKDRVTYKKGTYRISKYYLDENYSETRKQYTVYAQFEIE